VEATSSIRHERESESEISFALYEPRAYTSGVNAGELLARAAEAEAACDLLVGAPAELAAAVISVFECEDVSRAPPRALWNLLWLAAELTVAVDVYRAEALLAAIERLFARHVAPAVADGGEAAEAAEMAFDFLVNRAEQPLESLRFERLVSALESLLALPSRVCRRAALHGLGHLRQRHAAEPRRARLEAAIDTCTDPALAAYAARARVGDVL
jgi:hypothetical protein